MRNRMIKKEFWTDDKILELEPVERLLFIGIWNFSDDEGVLKNNSKVLKAQIFPADDITAEDINLVIKNMVKIGLLLINNDATLLKVKNWEDHQKINRPTPSKYKFVPGETASFTEDSVITHGALTTNRIEKNIKKKNIIHQSKKKDELFDTWYDKYPRKVGKQAAIKAFNRLTLKNKKIAIDKLDSHIKHWIKTDTEMEHIPHPSTWLNQERFDDVLEATNLKEQLRADRVARQEAKDRAEREHLAKEANSPEARAEKQRALADAKRAIRGY